MSSLFTPSSLFNPSESGDLYCPVSGMFSPAAARYNQHGLQFCGVPKVVSIITILYILVHIAFLLKIKFTDQDECDMNSYEKFVDSKAGYSLIIIAAIGLGALSFAVPKGHGITGSSRRRY